MALLLIGQIENTQHAILKDPNDTTVAREMSDYKFKFHVNDAYWVCWLRPPIVLCLIEITSDGGTSRHCKFFERMRHRGFIGIIL
jgi:hypothetical protein